MQHATKSAAAMTLICRHHADSAGVGESVSGRSESAKSPEAKHIAASQRIGRPPGTLESPRLRGATAHGRTVETIESAAMRFKVERRFARIIPAAAPPEERGD